MLALSGPKYLSLSQVSHDVVGGLLDWEMIVMTVSDDCVPDAGEK